MATEDLGDAVKQCLKDRGVLDQVTATVRAEVVKALKGQDQELDSPRNPLSSDNFLLNELILEYRKTIRPLYAFVSRRVGGDRALAEDLVQETW